MGPGFLIDGRYRVERRLGTGGMGDVYLVVDTWLNKPRALKVLNEKILAEPRVADLLRKEVLTAQELKHHYICATYHLGVAGGLPYIVMEFVEGETLYSFIHRQPGRRCDSTTFLRLAKQIISAIAYAHENQVIHRDLKPMNIMVTPDVSVRIMDFGIATNLKEAITPTGAGPVICSPPYASPEQILGKRAAISMDIYALGCIFYEMLTGEPPFCRGEILYQQLNIEPEPMQGVPQQLHESVLWCLKKTVAERCPSAAALDAKLFAVAVAPTVRIAPRAGETRMNPKDGQTYVWIPPGVFTMGASPDDSEADDDERPAHEVEITRGFWIAQTPVTVGAWKRFAADTGKPAPPGDDRLPMVHIFWDDAREFCAWAGGRLPTEAEWEYAARAGNRTARYGELDRIAWYGNNSGDVVHAVGQKEPNAWGLYDTLGNVWEWVNDWHFASYYAWGPRVDPKGPATGAYKILRGGSRVSYPEMLRVSSRFRNKPGYGFISSGCRCAGVSFP